MIDLHTHHERCGHALGELEDYARAALRRGLTTLGMSDHAPLLLEDVGGADVEDEPAPGMHMPASAFDGYLAEAADLRLRYAGRIELLVGVEADYLAGREAAYAELLSDGRLDYALGAVHYVDGRHVYDRARWRGEGDVDTVYARYLELVRDAAATGLFDVLAHIDAIKAYAPRPPRAPEREWDVTVEALSAADVAVEINTSGLRKCGEPFPAWGLIERLSEARVPLTFGSDAHTPDEVHYGYDVIRRGLLERGIDTLALLHGRARSTVPI